MKDTEYYTELTDNMIETQCMLDLCNGEITIKDVPFEFRNFDFEMFWQGVGKRC